MANESAHQPSLDPGDERKCPYSTPITIIGEELECIDDFIYLESIISSDNGVEARGASKLTLQHLEV